MNFEKEDLFIEIKEATEMIGEENDFKKILYDSENILFENIVVLSFIEDEDTEALLGYFYNKTSSKIYEYIYTPATKNLSINEIKHQLSHKDCRTIAVLKDYLNLSRLEIEALG